MLTAISVAADHAHHTVIGACLAVGGAFIASVVSAWSSYARAKQRVQRAESRAEESVAVATRAVQDAQEAVRRADERAAWKVNDAQTWWIDTANTALAKAGAQHRLRIMIKWPLAQDPIEAYVSKD